MALLSFLSLCRCCHQAGAMFPRPCPRGQLKAIMRAQSVWELSSPFPDPPLSSPRTLLPILHLGDSAGDSKDQDTAQALFHQGLQHFFQPVHAIPALAGGGGRHRGAERSRWQARVLSTPLLRAKLHTAPGGLKPHSTRRGGNAPTKQMGKPRPPEAELWNLAAEGPSKVLTELAFAVQLSFATDSAMMSLVMNG